VKEGSVQERGIALGSTHIALREQTSGINDIFRACTLVFLNSGQELKDLYISQVFDVQYLISG
jgi:hypothetical protein